MPSTASRPTHAPFLDDDTRQALCDAALRLARAANYTHAGTVEFQMDADTDAFYFLEVNPRIQVKHTVTEQITGVDIVKAAQRFLQQPRRREGGGGWCLLSGRLQRPAAC